MCTEPAVTRGATARDEAGSRWQDEEPGPVPRAFLGQCTPPRAMSPVVAQGHRDHFSVPLGGSGVLMAQG